MISNMLEYYKLTEKFDVDIIYTGALWADGIEGLGTTLRRQMELEDLSVSASQKVFSVFVELMNNMLMYAVEKMDIEGHPGVPKGSFILASKNKVHFAQSGNVMQSESAELIKSRIDYLNTLDKPALRKYFKEQLRNENTSFESNGAGLGLIEVAKRASAPIEYQFIPYGDGLTFLVIGVTIG